MDYVRDPAQITERSFRIVRREAALDDIPHDLTGLVTRLVHACGMVDIIPDLVHRGDVVAAGRAALNSGKPVLVDCKMVAAGITRGRLPAANPVICTLDEIDRKSAARQGTTRSAAAVDLWRAKLAGAVVAVGNAPTALFRLLELLDEGAPEPAVILGFPVGFVGAADSKEALIASRHDVPFITLRGRRGGSPLASAAVNALAAP